MSKVIAITTGDLDGIGLEVTLKALTALKKSRSTFLIFKGPSPKNKPWSNLPQSETVSVKKANEALNFLSGGKQTRPRFILIENGESPALWVKESTELCLAKMIDGMVTGPVSKKTFIDSSLGCLGHTPLLQKICGTKEAMMGFLGKFFNVILLSGHLPVSEIEKGLDKNTLQSRYRVILEWQKNLPTKLNKRPLGILGLNPHAGEEGLIGRFEQDQLIPSFEGFKSLDGPLVPDAAFARENWNKYSFYLALYHDQGLIPFKMIHGHSGGAHVTVGLPIVRTSVDHGTAKDLFGKDQAQYSSMLDAIQWCECLIGKKG